MMPSNGPGLQTQALALHQRLLCGDPVAQRDVFEQVLGPLISRLNRRWPGLARTDATYDAAVDALVTYLQAPARYDPTRASLIGWLEMQAHRDLANDRASRPRRFEQSWLVDSNLSTAGDGRVVIGDQIAVVDLISNEQNSGLFTTIREAFPDRQDRELIWLHCVEGDSSTASAAAVLGLTDQPKHEQALEVKRRKDRIMKKLRRMELGD